ncbi:MAG: hypothetical protein JKY51_08775, partial [Opitutaceae bacterium]|nr:hypothetical protein [Opitutaceae bacterium]
MKRLLVQFPHALFPLALLPLAPAPLGVATATSAATVTDITAPTTDFSKPERYEAFPGGAATSFKRINRDSFSHSSANMNFERQLDFKVGNGFFKRVWVSSPASTRAADGLGPLFNARSCQSCHLKDGRGHAPAANWPDDDAVSMFLRLSIPPQTAAETEAIKSGRQSVIPAPVYGGQLQDFAIPGVKPEGRMTIAYTESSITLQGGETVNLRKPKYAIAAPEYGPPHPQIMLSPRVTPPMIGLGLLEFIDARSILANADPKDENKDGVSGRPNRVWSEEQGKVVLGRFGWKAGQPSLRQQNAHAFNGDIGISTPLTPSPNGDCTAHQKKCLAAPNGDSPEADNLEAPRKVTDLVLFYTRNLAVPARRDIANPDVLAGKGLFYTSGCAQCHTPKFITRRDSRQLEQSHQLIWPYTDLLLHDMGEGLADHRP